MTLENTADVLSQHITTPPAMTPEAILAAIKKNGTRCLGS